MTVFPGASLAQAACRAAAAMLAPILLLAVAGCSVDPGAEPDNAPPSPLLYELASNDGAVEGWMLGTIHALPPGTRWRTPAITQVVARADLLVVEIAALGDGAELSRVFAELARSRGLPPLDQRLPADLRPALAALLERGGTRAREFQSSETWAAALSLAQITGEGDPANGVDRAIIADFAGRRVREFEGARGQLTIFDRLPETEQRDLLAAVVAQSVQSPQTAQRLQRAWLTGDVAALEQASRTGILADPQLREALLLARNRRWAQAIVPMLDSAPRPLIAVGAAHLVGPEGLVALLAARGYRVRRLP
jgi:uncharacterized protein YbaP (TraB family)